MQALLTYCRAGFEQDAANELQQKTAELGVAGYVQTQPELGYVLFHSLVPDDLQRLLETLPLSQLIFSRQLIWVQGEAKDLDSNDRIGGILAQLPAGVFGDVWVEHADTPTGRDLAKFCRKFTVPLRQALRRKGCLTERSTLKKPLLHVFFCKPNQALIGLSVPHNRNPNSNGILRLRFPSAAPSRSTLKLDEAILTFLSGAQQQRLQGKRAVDLGACPGGWTYQLVRRGMQVQAVDNGAMAESLMQTGLVTYCAEDGFRFSPRHGPVDLLVCDMIEKPQRIAALMASWLCKGWAPMAIFNLKLPMKKRYQMVQECLQIIASSLSQAHLDAECLAKQLYHDREEVTVMLRVR